MKDLIKYINESIKSNIKTIKDFAEKYNCKCVTKYYCYINDELENLFDHLLSIQDNKFTELENNINKELSNYDYNKDKYEFYIKRDRKLKTISIVCKCDIKGVGVCGEILIKPYMEHQYIITLDPNKKDENVQITLFKLLEYIINNKI